MVDRMMPQSLLQMLLAAGLGAVAMPSAAQGMTDPTQPPASLAASGPGEVVVAPSGLQTIIRRNSATPGAIISGHYVELGGMVGEAKLVKVGEDRVELRGFGAFSVTERDARKGRNPRTGEAVAVDEKVVPFFKTGKELRDRLNGRAETPGTGDGGAGASSPTTGSQPSGPAGEPHKESSPVGN